MILCIVLPSFNQIVQDRASGIKGGKPLDKLKVYHHSDWGQAVNVEFSLCDLCKSPDASCRGALHALMLAADFSLRIHGAG